MEKSPLLFDPKDKSTYYIVDDAGMVVCKHDPDSWRDSLGRTFLAWIAYDQEELIDSILACMRFHADGSVSINRHPINGCSDMSRDHVTYALLAMKFFDRDVLKKLIKGLKWRISEKATFTPDMWCWMKSLTGSFLWRVAFYITSIPTIIVNILRNRWLYKKAGITGEEVHHTEFVKIPNSDQPEIIQEISHRVFPAYALHILSWQLFVMPNSIGKKIMCKLALKLCGRYNYLVRILLGDKTVTPDDVARYYSFENYRWGVWLSELNRRNTKPIKPEETYTNDLEKDLLLILFINQHFKFLENKLV